MGFFSKTRKTAGWMAVVFQKDGICAASIKRMPEGLPQVELAVFYPTDNADEASRAAVLGKIAKELQIKSYQCTTLLASGEYQLLSVDAPNVPREEWKTAIRWRLKDMLDFSVDDATVDVVDIPLDKENASRAHGIYVAVARNQIVEQRQKLFSEARFSLRSIDIPEMAQRNIAALLEPAGRGVAMLTFDAIGGLLTVSYSGELYLSRRVDISMEQLLKVKDNTEQLNGLFERITLELQRSLDHFERQYQFFSVAKLIIFSAAEVEQQLKAYLSSNLYVPVEILDWEAALDFSKIDDFKSSFDRQRFFMTLGAALRNEGNGERAR